MKATARGRRNGSPEARDVRNFCRTLTLTAENGYDESLLSMVWYELRHVSKSRLFDVLARMRSRDEDYRMRVIGTLIAINNHYGRGDVHHVDMAARTVTCRMPYAGTETLKFRVRGDKVFFRGRKRNLPPSLFW